MRSTDWLQLALFVAALALITKPMGLYLAQVMDGYGSQRSPMTCLEAMNHSLKELCHNNFLQKRVAPGGFYVCNAAQKAPSGNAGELHITDA